MKLKLFVGHTCSGKTSNIINHIWNNSSLYEHIYIFSNNNNDVMDYRFNINDKVSNISFKDIDDIEEITKTLNKNHNILFVIENQNNINIIKAVEKYKGRLTIYHTIFTYNQINQNYFEKFSSVEILKFRRIKL